MSIILLLNPRTSTHELITFLIRDERERKSFVIDVSGLYHPLPTYLALLIVPHGSFHKIIFRIPGKIKSLWVNNSLKYFFKKETFPWLDFWKCISSQTCLFTRRLFHKYIHRKCFAFVKFIAIFGETVRTLCTYLAGCVSNQVVAVIHAVLCFSLVLTFFKVNLMLRKKALNSILTFG